MSSNVTVFINCVASCMKLKEYGKRRRVWLLENGYCVPCTGKAHLYDPACHEGAITPDEPSHMSSK